MDCHGDKLEGDSVVQRRSTIYLTEFEMRKEREGKYDWLVRFNKLPGEFTGEMCSY